MGIYDLFRLASQSTFPKGEGIWKLIFCDGFYKNFYLKSKQIESLPLLYMKSLFHI